MTSWIWRDKDGGGVYAPPSETGAPYIAMHAMWLREALPWAPQIWIREDKRRIYLNAKKDVDAWFDYGPDPSGLAIADAPYDGAMSVSAGSRLRVCGRKGRRQSQWWFRTIGETLEKAEAALFRQER